MSREVTDFYAKDVFPNGILPTCIIEAARLAVKCSYAKSGKYAAALLVRRCEGVPRARIVIEPTKDEVDGQVAYYTQQYLSEDDAEPDVAFLEQRDMVHAHTESLATLYQLIDDQQSTGDMS